MKWRKKQHPHKKKAEEIKETPLPTRPPPSSSSIFSFSAWISKFKKKKMTSNTTEQRRSTTGPHQKRLFSPPRSKSDRHPDVPRSRTCRIPPLLDFEFGSDLDLIASPATNPGVRRRRNADRGITKEIEVDSNPIQLEPIEIRDRKGENRRRPIKSGRRSFSGKVRPRVRVYSPRLKKRAMMGEEEWESFAVVKRSSDPTRDFRESMVEMIREKGIQRLEELERLLACYLSLNSHEHHDVIVKVFRQVWFDLNREVRRSGVPV